MASDDDAEETDNGGTTDQDYRWKWLSTVWVLLYGVGFPAWVMASRIYPYTLTVDGTLMGVLVIAWGGTVVFTIGPENIRAWQSLRK